MAQLVAMQPPTTQSSLHVWPGKLMAAKLSQVSSGVEVVGAAVVSGADGSKVAGAEVTGEALGDGAVGGLVGCGAVGAVGAAVTPSSGTHRSGVSG